MFEKVSVFWDWTTVSSKEFFAVDDDNLRSALIMADKGLGSNPGEDLDVCKCIVSSRQGATLNSRRATSPLVRLVAGNESLEAPGSPKLGWNRAKSHCQLVFKATANDRRISSPLP
ncbi:hypothetical protein TNCV_187151 [Trichonephila clavipes]|nr:hypothetical protein TNCV_187151 [Trichonephila clavipes]